MRGRVGDLSPFFFELARKTGRLLSTFDVTHSDFQGVRF
jgi:hypothetical protein